MARVRCDEENCHTDLSPPFVTGYEVAAGAWRCLNDDKVFSLPTTSRVSIILGNWAKAANVKKEITFHVASHSISSSSLKTNDLQNFNLRQVTI